MIHLRLVVPAASSERVLEVLTGFDEVTDVVHVPGAARKPPGDLVLATVAREETSVVVAELKELGVESAGSITIEDVDTHLSDAGEKADAAAEDLPFGDEVVWEEVEERVSEETTLSINFLELIMIASLIAAGGILLDSPILIVGAMVVGPDFGPLAGFCVALVQRERELARRSLTALAVGLLAAVVVAYVGTVLLRWTGTIPHLLPPRRQTLFISRPDVFSFLIAYLAGTAGMLSLTSAKSGALVGVLISVTTIPAAAGIGVNSAYHEWSNARGSCIQLAVNLIAIVLGAVARLFVQHRMYVIRRRRHERNETVRAR